MKIQDLFENIPHRLPVDQGKLPFDLADDLIFFMRNDDDFYRRHFYPHICKIKGHVKQGQNLSPRVFMPMVSHAFECYTKKFPIRELPESLEEDLIEEICTKLRKEEVQHINNNIY